MAIRLGTRASPLALAQARGVAELLGDAEIVPIRTVGDEGPGGAADGEGTPVTTIDPAARDERSEPGASSAAVGAAVQDKGRFVREIERALLAGEVDLAVHSAKDLPSDLPEGLEIAGVPVREDPADAFVGAAASLAALPEGARIGTSSLRRRSQLLALRPDLEVVEMRGNVDTRLRRLVERGLDGILLAAAGLRRLGLEGEIAFRFERGELTPAPGQGTLVLEARTADAEAAPAAAAASSLAAVAAAASRITDPDALAELTAERAVVAELEASCQTPIGVNASLERDRIAIEGFVGLPDGSEWLRDALEADAGDPAGLGRELASRLAAAGAGELLERATREAAR